MKPVAFVRFCFSAICFVVLSHFVIAQETPFTAKQGLAAAQQAAMEFGLTNARLVSIHTVGTRGERMYDSVEYQAYWWNGKAYKWTYSFYTPSEKNFYDFTVRISNEKQNVIKEDEVFIKNLDSTGIGQDWIDSDSIPNKIKTQGLGFTTISVDAIVILRYTEALYNYAYEKEIIDKVTWESRSMDSLRSALYDASNGELIKGYIVSISESFKNSNIKLYPNPSSSNITIQFLEQNFTTIEIRTILGELVTSLKIEEGSDSHNIPIENFPTSGQYFLHLKGKNPAVIPVVIYR